jgi:thioredoxin reductase (NADPH)
MSANGMVRPCSCPADKRSLPGAPKSRSTGEETRRPLRHLFLFIGADPNTDWLKGSGLALDPKGFVLTGSESSRPLETSVRRVFAIGDVRSGSTKRVAAAVGEGAQVVAALHAFLAEPGSRPADVLKLGSA